MCLRLKVIPQFSLAIPCRSYSHIFYLQQVITNSDETGLLYHPIILNIMSNDNSSIHDFDFNLICEYFSHVERQGPGSPEVTLRALSFTEPLTENARIADIGCGTGGQTMTLAQYCPGQITGIDLFPRFIDLFNRNAAAHNLQPRVK